MRYLGISKLEAEYMLVDKVNGHIKVDFSKLDNEEERQRLYKRIEKKILNNENIIVVNLIWKEVKEDVKNL